MGGGQQVHVATVESEVEGYKKITEAATLSLAEKSKGNSQKEEKPKKEKKSKSVTVIEQTGPAVTAPVEFPLTPPEDTLLNIMELNRISLCIITSALYSKLAVIVCLAFLLSQVITLNAPLYFLEIPPTISIFSLGENSLSGWMDGWCAGNITSLPKDKEVKKDEQVTSDAAASKSDERKQSFLQLWQSSQEFHTRKVVYIISSHPPSSSLSSARKKSSASSPQLRFEAKFLKFTGSHEILN